MTAEVPCERTRRTPVGMGRGCEGLLAAEAFGVIPGGDEQCGRCVRADTRLTVPLLAQKVPEGSARAGRSSGRRGLARRSRARGVLPRQRASEAVSR